MDAIKFHGLGSLFDPQLTSEINPVLVHKSSVNDKPDPLDHITQIVDDLNHFLTVLNTTLRFHVDNESDIFYVAVIDTQTNEMLRRFPIEELPNPAAIQYKPSGVFLNTKG